MKPRSAKLAAYERASQPSRVRVLVEANFHCQVREVLVAFVRRWDGLPLPAAYERAASRGVRDCYGRAGGVHELRKRSSGGSLDNPANLMAACSTCNHWVEEFPELAHHLRLVVRPGDPDWDELGR